MGGETNALAAQWIWHVTAAHEEAVYGVIISVVVVGPADGGGVEAGAAGGVGGERGEEGGEVGLESTVRSESDVGVAADIVEYRGG